MNREEKILIQRATPLVFGIFEQAERPPDQAKVFGGSGLSFSLFKLDSDLGAGNHANNGRLSYSLGQMQSLCLFTTAISNKPIRKYGIL